MRTEYQRHDTSDAILNAGEGESPCDAWTLEELADELGVDPDDAELHTA